VMSLSDWLKMSNVPAIFGVDTRALTKKLRSQGSMLGKIIQLRQDRFDNISDSIISSIIDRIPFSDPNKINLVEKVSIKEPQVFTPRQFDSTIHPSILAIDLGIKA